MKPYIFVLFFLTFVLLGAGCRWPSKNAPRPSATESPVYLPPPPPPESENARNLRELRSALEAFKEVKTFRAKLVIDGKDGQTTGQIEIMKPDRFRGTVRFPKDDQTSEVIGVGDTLYVKLPDSTWTSISTPAVSKALTQAFRAAVDGDQSAVKTALPDDAAVAKRTDEVRGCDEYTAPIQGAEDATIDMSVCVGQGLPVSIRLQSGTGSVTIDYFDYNKLFVIERPTIGR